MRLCRGWLGTAYSRPTGSSPPTDGPWPPALGSSLIGTPTGSATGPAACGPWSGGRWTSTPSASPSQHLPAARAARRVDQDETVALGRRAGRLAGLPARLLEVEELRADQRRRLLGAYDYQRQLERGYSVTRAASGAVLRSVEGLAPGTALVTQLADGTVDSTVTNTTSKDTTDTTKGSN